MHEDLLELGNKLKAELSLKTLLIWKTTTKSSGMNETSWSILQVRPTGNPAFIALLIPGKFDGWRQIYGRYFTLITSLILTTRLHPILHPLI